MRFNSMHAGSVPHEVNLIGPEGQTAASGFAIEKIMVVLPHETVRHVDWICHGLCGVVGNC